MMFIIFRDSNTSAGFVTTRILLEQLLITAYGATVTARIIALCAGCVTKRLPQVLFFLLLIRNLSRLNHRPRRPLWHLISTDQPSQPTLSTWSWYYGLSDMLFHGLGSKIRLFERLSLLSIVLPRFAQEPGQHNNRLFYILDCTKRQSKRSRWVVIFTLWSISVTQILILIFDLKWS